MNIKIFAQRVVAVFGELPFIGCGSQKWGIDFENGNGEPIGQQMDDLIADARLIANGWYDEKSEDQKHTPLPWTKFKNRMSLEIIAGEDQIMDLTIAIFYGPDREANAQLFMEAPGMKATMNLMEAQHDAAIDAMKLYHSVEVTKLRGEIERLKTALEKALDELDTWQLFAA